MSNLVDEKQGQEIKGLMEDKRAIFQLHQQLTGRTREIVKNHADICKNKTDLKYLIEFVDNPRRWKYPKVSWDTFLDSEEYLGVGDKIYSKVRKIGRDIIKGKYSEAVVLAGIGAGKTTLAELLACYMTHHLLCLDDPHEYYNLAKDKPISIMNMGTTSTQALDNVFKGIKTFMKKSPWFLRHNPRILNETINFVNPDILLLSGNSKSTTALGYNLFYAVLDEAAFYLDTDNKQVAEDIYNALQRRIVSRFGRDGLVVAISSPNYDGDFITTKLQEAETYPDLIYGATMPTWQSRPIPQEELDNRFYFDSKQNIVLEGKPEKIHLTSKLDTPFDRNKLYWEIPGDFKKAFLTDPDKARRDFAGVASKAIQGFISHHDMIKAMFTEDESPVTDSGDYVFKEPPLRCSYFIHVDLALNRKGKGDFAGFSMAHCEGWEENEKTGEKQKKIVIDLAERIGAGPTGEVDFADVRNKIYTLQKMGYAIKLVTFDNFQSADMIQTLKRKGIRAEYLSVDRTIEPYQTLKETIYGGSISCHKMEILEEELMRLEVTKNNKVDHPPGSSKDVSDAVCGAVYNTIKHSGSAMGILTPNSLNTTAQQRQQHGLLGDPVQRAKHYDKVQEFLDKGLFG